MTEEEYITFCKLLGKLKFNILKDIQTVIQKEVRDDLCNDINAINRVFKICNYCEDGLLWVRESYE